jgi:hypothetical protein
LLLASALWAARLEASPFRRRQHLVRYSHAFCRRRGHLELPARCGEPLLLAQPPRVTPARGRVAGRVPTLNFGRGRAWPGQKGRRRAACARENALEYRRPSPEETPRESGIDGGAKTNSAKGIESNDGRCSTLLEVNAAPIASSNPPTPTPYVLDACGLASGTPLPTSCSHPVEPQNLAAPDPAP